MKHKFSTWFLLAVMLLSAVSYMVIPVSDKNNENRTLATFDMVFRPNRDSVVYRDSPVERLDAALSDQIPFRRQLTGWYLSVFNASENLFSSLLRTAGDEREQQELREQHTLHTAGNYALIDDTGYITVFPSAVPYDQGLLDAHTEQLRKLHEIDPTLKMYVYFVTQAYDTDWFDTFLGVRMPDHFSQIRGALPEYVKSGRLVYTGLEDYMDIHYKTDHHWNHKGAQRGYEDVYAMLSEDFALSPMLTPTAENNVSRIYDFTYKGSYARGLEELYKGEYDDFSFYEYAFPGRESLALDPATLEETQLAEMGLYEEYRTGRMNIKPDTDHYKKLYGTAVDSDGNRYADSDYVFVIRSSEGNGKCLLICGDSYSRAIRDPLSAHFSTVVYLDYRLMKDLPVDTLLERYGADAILIGSNASMWNNEEYYFTFSEDK